MDELINTFHSQKSSLQMTYNILEHQFHYNRYLVLQTAINDDVEEK